MKSFADMLKPLQQFQPETKSQKRKFVLIAVDVSESMGCSDWLGTRLGCVKKTLIEFFMRKRRSNPYDRYGIISFNHAAQMIHPPWVIIQGYEQARQVIQGLQPSGGSNLREALHTCANIIYGDLSAFDHFDRMSRILGADLHFDPQPIVPNPEILLITDGEGGDPRSMANWLKNKGVVIQCIGIGKYPYEVNESLLREISSSRNHSSLCWTPWNEDMFEELFGSF